MNEILQKYKHSKKSEALKGFEKLKKVDNVGYAIIKAGESWNNFPFKEGYKEILKKEKAAELIYLAGKDWRWEERDIDKMFKDLYGKDKKGKWMHTAYDMWNDFDKVKLLNMILGDKRFSSMKKRLKKELNMLETLKNLLEDVRRIK